MNLSPDLRNELQNFAKFVCNRFSGEGPVPSPEDCLRLWRERRESSEAIMQGLAEAEAGLGTPYREFLACLRSERKKLTARES